MRIQVAFLAVLLSAAAGAQTTQTDCHQFGSNITCTTQPATPPCRGVFCVLGDMARGMAADQANRALATDEAARRAAETNRFLADINRRAENAANDSIALKLFDGRLGSISQEIRDSTGISYFPRLVRGYSVTLLMASLDLWRADPHASNQAIKDEFLSLAPPYASVAKREILRFYGVAQPLADAQHVRGDARDALLTEAWSAFVGDGSVDVSNDSPAEIRAKIKPTFDAYRREHPPTTKKGAVRTKL